MDMYMTLTHRGLVTVTSSVALLPLQLRRVLASNDNPRLTSTRGQAHTAKPCRFVSQTVAASNSPAHEGFHTSHNFQGICALARVCTRDPSRYDTIFNVMAIA